MKPIRELHQLTLREYRDVLAPSGLPSDEQIERFIPYVANAHSWYKHIPPFPPGAPFWFFLDPGAGYETRLDAAGRVSYHERTEPFGFHYNYRPTAVWRRDFGALHWHCNEGITILVGGTGELTERPYDGPTILHPEFGACRLPPEVEAAGMTYLTGAMHAYSFQCLARPFAFLRCGYPHPQSVDWPEEYGGNELRDRVVGLAVEEQMELLKVPARSQYEVMRRAIRAMCEVAFPEAG